MRLLSVGSLPPELGGPTRGGVATFHATLLEGLAERSDAVEVVGVMPPTPLADEAPFPVFARPDGVGIADFYEELLARLEPDAVLMNHFAHTTGVTHAGLSDPPPAVGVAHSWHSITFCEGEERERARVVNEKALAGLTALTAGSRHCIEEGSHLGLRYPPTTAVIPHPLQPLYLDPSLEVEGGERSGVLFLGSLVPRKNPAALVEAAAWLPGVEVALTGEGELEASLRALVERLRLGDRVEIGGVGEDEHLRRVRDRLRGARVMCLPSSSESFGLSFVEALACGTPVVGFGPTVREIREEVGIEIGEPLDEPTPEAIAAALERVLAVRWDGAALRRASVDRFGLRRATDRYVELLSRVAAPRSAQAAAGRAASSPSPAFSPPSRAATSTAVCVLGMSRSGTSLTARVLAAAGVYLGSEEELLGTELHQLRGEDEAVREPRARRTRRASGSTTG